MEDSVSRAARTREATLASHSDPAVAPFERAAELAAVEWLGGAVAAEGPAALLIEGDAGIGKTLLWQHGAKLAARRGFAVLRVQPRPADADLPFLGLTELLDPIADRMVPLLSAPLARALNALLLREEKPGPTDRRTVFMAATGAILALAADERVIIAIDDLQWLDAESASALAFAIPRLGRARVGLLLSRRLGEPETTALELERALPEDRVRAIRVGPLTLRGLRQLLASRAGLAAARPEAARIHALSGGNPFYALEIARLMAASAVGPRPGERLPLPQSIRSLVAQRLQALPPAARRPLIAAALIARPTVAAVATAAEAAPADWVDVAVLAGLLHVEQGMVAFTHPLFAAGVVDLALPEEVRELHERIASIVSDPEERAVHLARGAYPPDARAAAALEDSARLASHRGARLAAADRFHQSALFTPADDQAGRVRRCHEAARAYRDAGSMQQAIAAAMEALALVHAGPERARLLLTMASTEAVPDMQAVLDEALQHTGSDGALRARILAYAGELEWLNRGLVAASVKFRAAADLAAAGGDAGTELRALGLAGIAATLLVTPDAADLLVRAQALGARGHDAGPWYSPTHWLAVRALWHDDLAAAIAGLELEYRRAEQNGNEFDQSGLAFHLATAHCRAGNLAAAAGYADIGYELASQFGSVQNLGVSCSGRALTLAWVGDADAARRVAAEGIAAARSSQDMFFEAHLRSAVTFLDVSVGNYGAAAAESARLPELVAALGIREPGVFPFAPDRIEALTAIGMLEEAEALTRQWVSLVAEPQRPRLRATGARCWALCRAARGDLAGARDAAVEALRGHDQFEAPLELARTLLVYGRITRRLKQKNQARDALSQARSMFSEAGARLWVGRVDAELSRIGGRTPSPLHLTASERSVADAVAAGATNRQAADQLFLSVRTVEAILSRVYRKLGVGSRTEMATVLRDRRGSPVA